MTTETQPDIGAAFVKANELYIIANTKKAEVAKVEEAISVERLKAQKTFDAAMVRANVALASARQKATDTRDGAADVEGLTLGTYMHGLFHNHSLRRTMLLNLAQRKGVTLPEGAALDLDAEYDKLADHIRQNVDMDVIYQMAGLK